MATNKAKRSIHLAQPQAPQPAALAPVKSHVYYAIAELNAGFEKAIQNMQTLQDNHLFGASGLSAMNRVLRGIRARANRQLMMALNQRETANAAHFQQLCQPEEPEKAARKAAD
jgi:hypothetical protein